MIELKPMAAHEAAKGKALRACLPRSNHAAWIPADERRDPVALLERSTRGRLKHLVPIRNSRMLDSPFAFFRGSAVVMAADLAQTPVTGLRVQACGDAHCMNFGGFATPERNVIFDINDFDETLPGPWEWDVKRLVTSVILAGRHNRHRPKDVKVAALAAAQSYRLRMQQLATLPALDIWYMRLDATKVLAEAKSADLRARRKKIANESITQSIHATVEKLTEVVDGRRRFRDDPPLIYHSKLTEHDGFDVETILAQYAQTLSPEMRVLYERYTLQDQVIKIVGVGSVGTRCAIALLSADDHDPLILQIKEAVPSVLETYLEPSVYDNHGERVVRGQRLMQAASDVFLGWASSGNHDFYVRQFKDMKSSADLDGVDTYQLREYAQYCAWALACGHARSGNVAAIAGYLGTGNAFDRSVLDFALAYAERSERDYEAFSRAVDDGRLETAEVSA